MALDKARELALFILHLLALNPFGGQSLQLIAKGNHSAQPALDNQPQDHEARN